MGEPSPPDIFFSIIGTSGFPTMERTNQHQHIASDLGYIPRESAGHSCSYDADGDVQGTIGMFEGV